MDRDISLDELDKVVDDCKKKSAPGPDGWSYKCLKFIWKLIRIPLLRGFDKMKEIGYLTYNFKTCNVKLIPKKGDFRSISNWRPICLLSVFYKIVSTVIANRLKKGY